MKRENWIIYYFLRKGKRTRDEVRGNGQRTTFLRVSCLSVSLPCLLATCFFPSRDFRRTPQIASRLTTTSFSYLPPLTSFRIRSAFIFANLFHNVIHSKETVIFSKHSSHCFPDVWLSFPGIPKIGSFSFIHCELHDEARPGSYRERQRRN